jgi:hypothetical protein
MCAMETNEERPPRLGLGLTGLTIFACGCALIYTMKARPIAAMSAAATAIGLLAGMYGVVTRSFIRSPLIASSVGCIFGGAVVGAYYGASLDDSPLLILLGVTIGVLWSGLFAIGGLVVYGLVAYFLEPRRVRVPSFVSGFVVGYGAMHFMSSIAPPIPAPCPALFSALIGGVSAVVAAIRHVESWQYRLRNDDRLPAEFRLADPATTPVPVANTRTSDHDSFRLRDPLEKPWRMKRW